MSLKKNQSNLRNSDGHYSSFVKKGIRNWKLHNDLRKKNSIKKNYIHVPRAFYY